MLVHASSPHATCAPSAPMSGKVEEDEELQNVHKQLCALAADPDVC